MAGQKTSSPSTTQSSETGLEIHAKDRNVLRRLAGKVAELAARPVEVEKRNSWYRHNALEAKRLLVFCDPENGWSEIITQVQLECIGSLARHWEMLLRKEIFWGEAMGDDRVVEPWFVVHYVSQESDWGMQPIMRGGQAGGSCVWNAPLTSYDDLDKLHAPTIAVDYEATNATVALAEKTLGDLLNVRLKGHWWWSLGMTWVCMTLRGLEQMMMDMYTEPDGLKRLMGILRDGHLAKIDFLGKNNLLSMNNDGTYVGSGGFGYTNELPQKDYDGKHVRTHDMWGFCESQETVLVSPDQFGEFVFPYQLPIMERFGMNCYGCCEPLDGRWHLIKQFPRLRRVSVSAWADWEKMAGLLQDKYIYSLKPNPASLAIPEMDQDYVRKELRRAIEVTQGCRLEIIMKDNHTIGKNPQNVINWCRIAREEAERV